MRAFRWFLVGVAGCALTVCSVSALSGCGDESQTGGTQVQETKEQQDENQRLMDNMKKSMEAKSEKKAGKK